MTASANYMKQVDPELQRNLRIACALLGTTQKDFVYDAIMEKIRTCGLDPKLFTWPQRGAATQPQP
jgi:hypothetical protein